MVKSNNRGTWRWRKHPVDRLVKMAAQHGWAATCRLTVLLAVYYCGRAGFAYVTALAVLNYR